RCTASRSRPSRRTSCSLPEAGSSAPRRSKTPLIGVLAMQGAFAEHVHALDAVGARTRLVRTRDDLSGLDGIVLPGGESTTMTMLMERVGLLEPVRKAIQSGLATLATCAGLIVLASDITDGMSDQQGLGLLDVSVRRNGYGRQAESFEASLKIDAPMAAIFFEQLVGQDERVHDPGSILMFRDHLTFLGEAMTPERVKEGLLDVALELEKKQRAFAQKHGIRLYGELRLGHHGSEAICHSKILEGHAEPGMVIIGSDSHTPH